MGSYRAECSEWQRGTKSSPRGAAGGLPRARDVQVGFSCREPTQGPGFRGSSVPGCLWRWGGQVVGGYSRLDRVCWLWAGTPGLRALPFTVVAPCKGEGGASCLGCMLRIRGRHRQSLSYAESLVENGELSNEASQSCPAATSPFPGCSSEVALGSTLGLVFVTPGLLQTPLGSQCRVTSTHACIS